MEQAPHRLRGRRDEQRDLHAPWCRADAPLLESVKLLRLPLGTGNDVADAPTFERGLRPDPRRPAHRADRRAGGDSGSRTAARYSFNVGSIGLDAYIAEPHQPVQARHPRPGVQGAGGHRLPVLRAAGEAAAHGHPDLTADRERPRVKGFVPSMVIVGISGQPDLRRPHARPARGGERLPGGRHEPDAQDHATRSSSTRAGTASCPRSRFYRARAWWRSVRLGPSRCSWTASSRGSARRASPFHFQSSSRKSTS